MYRGWVTSDSAPATAIYSGEAGPHEAGQK